MCGICGEVRTSGDVSVLELSELTKAMQPRGPDAAGFFAQGSLGFGHRRLSILDLAPSSQQPMVDSEFGLGVVFNGCIYNFRELRTELSGKGYCFFSQGDTEVILKAYHAGERAASASSKACLRLQFGNATAAGFSLREIGSGLRP